MTAGIDLLGISDVTMRRLHVDTLWILGAVNYYLLSDQLSVRLISVNATVKGQQGHLPFGEDFAESGTQQQKQHFTSYERDSQSGTDYAVNRTYSFGVGRFQSADPFQSSDGPSAPQSWNRYAYVMNAPADFIDPLGLNRSEFLPGDSCGATGTGGTSPPIVPTGCSVTLPPDRNHLAIIYTVMHEHTSFGRIGQQEYLPTDKNGQPTGAAIDQSTLGAEAFMFGNAIIWRARTIRRSVYDTVIAYVHDANHDGLWWYNDGRDKAAAALLMPNGTNECEELKAAKFAAELLDVPYASVPFATYQWWRGHNGRPGLRRKGHVVMQFGDTDFLDYDPTRK